MGFHYDVIYQQPIVIRKAYIGVDKSKDKDICFKHLQFFNDLFKLIVLDKSAT